MDTRQDHRSLDELHAGLAVIRDAPRAAGVVAMIVRRPSVDVRQVVDEAAIDQALGLIGDRWADGNRHRTDMQVTLMGVRAATAIAGPREYWPAAGDQLFVDFDLSVASLPAGTRVAVGAALLEISARPHLGCVKFAARYGEAALAWVNSDVGRALRLRGVNARVISGGAIRVGDAVRLNSQPVETTAPLAPK